MKGIKLDFIDVRRAYFHSNARRQIFVQLPHEDYEEGQCGELVQAMYGTRMLHRTGNMNTVTSWKALDSNVARHPHAHSDKKR